MYILCINYILEIRIVRGHVEVNLSHGSHSTHTHHVEHDVSKLSLENRAQPPGRFELSKDMLK